jgi:hypothetical protein
MQKVKNDKIVLYYRGNIKNHHRIAGLLTAELIAELVAVYWGVEWAVF